MCVAIARDAKSLTEEGMYLADVRLYTETTYGVFAPGADTPPPSTETP